MTKNNKIRNIVLATGLAAALAGCQSKSDVMFNNIEEPNRTNYNRPSKLEYLQGLERACYKYCSDKTKQFEVCEDVPGYDALHSEMYDCFRDCGASAHNADELAYKGFSRLNKIFDENCKEK